MCGRLHKGEDEPRGVVVMRACSMVHKRERRGVTRLSSEYGVWVKVMHMYGRTIENETRTRDS